MTINKLQPYERRILDLLIAHLPKVKPGDAKTYLGYAQVHRMLGLSQEAPTWGRSLQIQGLESIARWAMAMNAPAITGLVIDKGPKGGWPAEGYFSVHGRSNEDFAFWIEETRAAKTFDWPALTRANAGTKVGDLRPDTMKNELIEITWSEHVVELLDLGTVTDTGTWITTHERWSGPALPNGSVQYRVFAMQLREDEQTCYELRYWSDEQPYQKAFEYGRSGRSLICLDESSHVQVAWIDDDSSSGLDGPALQVRLLPRTSAAGLHATVNRSGSGERFRSAVLAKVSPEHIWLAVQGLQNGSLQLHPFGESTDFDLVSDDGQRLPPEAVFGIALSMSLEIPVEPKHFSGGEKSPSFRILRAAGFRVIPKDEPTPNNELEIEEGEWEEGRQFIRSHVARERASGLAKAKKAQFVRLNGVLKCEQCGLVPTEHYSTALADSCIEVHHAKTLVSQMGTVHKTRLEDLQCLCANCHRLVHRQLRERTQK